MSTKKQMNVIELLGNIRNLALDKKGGDILALDMHGLSSITDYFLIVTANSQPHLKSLADYIDVEMKKLKQQCFRKAGTPDSNWMILDYVDVVVHLMGEETREFYALEQFWNDAKIVSFT